MSNNFHTEQRLDNPIWHALTHQHAAFAVGEGLARRYQREVSPFAAVAEHSPQAFAQLAELIPPNDVIALLGIQPPDLTGWTLLRQIPLYQMVYDGAIPEAIATESPIQPLSAGDLPAILPLIELTRPGPFQPRTLELGNYYAIWQGERLAAMAGERMRLPGYREISAVCTHPDYQRRGYARQLVQHLTREMHSTGDVPFLHVFDENKSAQALYMSLGFRTRLQCPIYVLKRQG